MCRVRVRPGRGAGGPARQQRNQMATEAACPLVVSTAILVLWVIGTFTGVVGPQPQPRVPSQGFYRRSLSFHQRSLGSLQDSSTKGSQPHEE